MINTWKILNSYRLSSRQRGILPAILNVLMWSGASALILTACGGGGSTGSNSSVNKSPTVTAIEDQAINEDSSTVPLIFTIGDAETAPESLVVTASSSDTTLIPQTNLVVDGSGANRTITVSPAPDLSGGPVTITVTVSDGLAATTETFTVTVSAQNDVPIVTSIPDQTIDEDSSTGILAFNVGDVETPAGSLLVTATASNPTLIPEENLVLGGSGASRTLIVSPAPDLNGGPVTITVNVSDGSATTPAAFTVTINAQNDTPTVTAITDQTIQEDSVMGPLTFTIGDVETPAGSLLVTANSNNQALIPDANVILGGSGVDRTIQATPLPDQGGAATITITVTDGTDAATTIFNVTVTPQNDPPMAMDEGFAVNQDAMDVPLDVLKNDLDPDFPFDTLTIVDVGVASAGGTVTNTGSQLLYTPVSGFSGVETFTYTIEDQAMASSMATVTVVVSSNGLIHYWKLDAASPPFADSADSALATCATCPAREIGQLIGSSQTFDGVDDELLVASTASINWAVNQSFGIEFWVRKSTVCSGDDAVIGRIDAQTQLKWWIGCDGAGKAVFELIDENGSGHRLIAPTNIDDGKWHHVAAIRDAGSGVNRLYVDGALKASASVTYTAAFTSQTADLTIGWLDDAASDYHFGGMVDEVALHAGVLSSADISQHYMDGFIGLRRGYLGCTGPVRIMPLGDSITRRQGYRPQLYFDLVGAGYDVDFVGSVVDSSGTHDRDNEGHSGFTVSDIAAGLNSWLTLNPPHVILLHIGTNEDPSFPYPSDTGVEDLLNIIDGFDPGISVVLARIINKVPNEPLVTQFNDNVESMAATRISVGDKVLMIDQESALNYIDDMDPDGIHPNAAGFAKMVPVWFNGLTSFLPLCPP